MFRHPGSSISSLTHDYALVVDADMPRTCAAVKSIKAFHVTVHVAQDGERAISTLHRLGPPRLLLVDLAMAGHSGFAVIEAARAFARGRTDIIAWASSRALREYAAHRLAGFRVRILRGAVAPSVLHTVVARMLDETDATDAASGTLPNAPRDSDEIANALADQAERLCRTHGLALHCQIPGTTGFRTAVRWTADTPVPGSAEWLPRVFDAILRTGEVLRLVGSDLVTVSGVPVPESALPGDVRGLVAVPLLIDEHRVAGVICVFDAAPLELEEAAVAALVALGRHGLGGLASAEPTVDAGTRSAGHARPGAHRMGSAGAPLPDVDDSPLLDRRNGDRAIAREFARARREQRPLSFVLFDVEPLDTMAGDAATSTPEDAVMTAARALARAIRGSDLAVHFRPEALLVVLPGLDAAAARPVAERMRVTLQAGARRDIAVAGGIAELLGDETFESVVMRALERVQLARKQGHNRVA